MNSSSRSILARSLMAGAASVAFMMANVAVVRAQTVIGADGAPGADCGTDNCTAGTGADGESVSSDGNPAAAIGGAGGAGGFAFPPNGFDGFSGNGGNATATAIGSPTSSATATGGAAGASNHGLDEIQDFGAGGNATATSTAISNGSGDATSSATATNGPGNSSVPATATATSSATASGSGGATASAIATGSVGQGINFQATSFAETAEGGLAQAQAQGGTFAGGSGALAQATAETTFGGVRAQSTVDTLFGELANAIAQGGSGQLPVDPGQLNVFAFSTALPNTAYATTLIGSASNVAHALLGPDDKIFGTAILGSGTSGFENGSLTLDFSFRGDLILGVIAGGFFDIVANGTDILSEEVGDNSVINLGSTLGPNIDLTIEGDGVFAVGGAVPESSTWAMMLLGFAGLGFMGWRSQRSRVPATI
jgi:hypothetical protein